ncbi:hypothetical protein B0H13DRAFT_1856260 [Mycena leptocephala]|nr:hypothetical protein B0H13DRAFT_1856260 [Mycena leptocephala]
MATTRSQCSARGERSERRKIRREAPTAPGSQRTPKARRMGAECSTRISSSPGPDPGHPGQLRSTTATPDDSPTTDIHWSEGEVETLLLRVGNRINLGNVNETSCHFLNKVSKASVPSALQLRHFQTRDQIWAGHEVLRKKELLPIRPPPSAFELKHCMAALRNSFRPKPRPEERAVGQLLPTADSGNDDGLSDADAEGEIRILFYFIS